MQKKQWVVFGILLGMFCLVSPFFIVETAQRPYVRIDRGASRTETREVTLYMLGPKDVEEMKVSNDESFDDIDWEPYRSRKDWTLEYGRGTKRVYVRFKDDDGDIDQTVYRDTIFLSIPEEMDVDMQIETEDDDDAITESRYVTVEADMSVGVEQIRLSEDRKFTGARWVDAQERLSFILSSGAGEKTVYAEFRDGNDKTKVLSDTVTYVETARALQDRTVLQGQGSAVYFLGVQGKLHPFFNSQVYFSWYDNFDDVVQVSDSKLSQYQIDTAVCMRAGTWLVKFVGLPDVYMPEPGCRLRPIYSEVEAYVLFGPQWAQRIAELPVYTRGSYRVVDPRTARIDDEDDDVDRDGVSDDVEREYGTSDRSKDSDGDGLSDFEEIYYWFTSPNNKDSDGDGFADGREILVGYSPLGPTRLGRIPDGTYQYPWGAVIRHPETDRLYIVDEEGEYRSLGSRITDSRIEENSISTRYIIDPPYDMNIAPISRTSFPRGVEHIMYPYYALNDTTILPL